MRLISFVSASVFMTGNMFVWSHPLMDKRGDVAVSSVIGNNAVSDNATQINSITVDASSISSSNGTTSTFISSNSSLTQLTQLAVEGNVNVNGTQTNNAFIKNISGENATVIGTLQNINQTIFDNRNITNQAFIDASQKYNQVFNTHIVDFDETAIEDQYEALTKLISQIQPKLLVPTKQVYASSAQSKKQKCNSSRSAKDIHRIRVLLDGLINKT